MPLVTAHTIESTKNCSPISGVELAKVAEEMEAFETNDERIEHLASVKGAYTFSTAHAKVLMDVTASIKTKMRMVEMLGPRIIDPKVRQPRTLSSATLSNPYLALKHSLSPPELQDNT